MFGALRAPAITPVARLFSSDLSRYTDSWLETTATVSSYQPARFRRRSVHVQPVVVGTSHRPRMYGCGGFPCGEANAQTVSPGWRLLTVPLAVTGDPIRARAAGLVMVMLGAFHMYSSR